MNVDIKSKQKTLLEDVLWLKLQNWTHPGTCKFGFSVKETLKTIKILLLSGLKHVGKYTNKRLIFTYS